MFINRTNVTSDSFLSCNANLLQALILNGHVKKIPLHMTTTCSGRRTKAAIHKKSEFSFHYLHFANQSVQLQQQASSRSSSSGTPVRPHIAKANYLKQVTETNNKLF
eukprot:Lankesteria_metandrocarpae@DN5196_c0_g1_i2.p1